MPACAEIAQIWRSDEPAQLFGPVRNRSRNRSFRLHLRRRRRPLDFDRSPAAEADEPTLARPRLRRPAEPLPETSFVDRYRGTEWQPESEPTPPAEAGQRRAPPAWLLMLGGVALTLVGLAALVSFVMGSVPSTPLGGFKQMTPEPTRSQAPPASPPAPTAAVLPAPPTQAPWLTDPLHPAGLFKAAMTAAGAAYRLDLTVTMDTGGQQAKDGPDS